MKPEKQDWPYRFLDEERLVMIEGAPSPLPDAIDLAAAINTFGVTQSISIPV